MLQAPMKSHTFAMLKIMIYAMNYHYKYLLQFIIYWQVLQATFKLEKGK